MYLLIPLGRNVIYFTFLSKMYNLNLIIRKHQQNLI